jgi:hypothetical protein
MTPACHLPCLFPKEILYTYISSFLVPRLCLLRESKNKAIALIFCVVSYIVGPV